MGSEPGPCRGRVHRSRPGGSPTDRACTPAPPGGRALSAPGSVCTGGSWPVMVIVAAHRGLLVGSVRGCAGSGRDRHSLRCVQGDAATGPSSRAVPVDLAANGASSLGGDHRGRPGSPRGGFRRGQAPSMLPAGRRDHRDERPPRGQAGLVRPVAAGSTRALPRRSPGQGRSAPRRPGRTSRGFASRV